MKENNELGITIIPSGAGAVSPTECQRVCLLEIQISPSQMKPIAAKAVTRWPLSGRWEDHRNRLAVSTLPGWGF